MNSNYRINLFISILILFTISIYTPIEVYAQNKSSKTRVHISSSNHHGRNTITLGLGTKDYKIEYEGDITLSDDDKDIIEISRGGFIEISKSAFGSRRKIVIDTDGKGGLIRQYFVERRKKEYEPEGRKWLAEILPQIVRTIPFGAESRIERFYSKGGANSVIEEIKKLEGDYISSIYLQILLRKKLSTKELEKVINIAGEEIESDHYLTQILKENQKAFFQNQNTITAYIEATKNIQSDHYTTEVMRRAIKDDNINDTQMTTMLAITKNIESDHYRTEILMEIMKRRELTKANLATIIKLSGEIRSDHYKTQVLKESLRTKNLSESAFQELIGTLKDIESDHYQSEVILELSSRNKLDDKTISLLLDLISKTLESNHYAAGVIKELTHNRDLTEDHLIKIINASGTIMNSDHYLTEVLVDIAWEVNRSSAKVKEAYRNACRRLKSEHYYGRAMRAID